MKSTNPLMIAGAMLSLLCTGALAVYNWKLQREVNELRGDSDVQQEILQQLEETAEQRAEAERQMPLFDPWTGMGLGGDPFQRLQQMQQQMDQLFSGMSGSMISGPNGTGGFSAFSSTLQQPEIVVEESDDEYRVVISIADGSNVDLSTELEENTLSISAEIRSEATGNGNNFQSTSVSRFSRSIRLDEPVNATGMQTEKNDEEIVITIPKVG